MVTSVVSNCSHSDDLNYQLLLNKSAALTKNEARVIFVILWNYVLISASLPSNGGFLSIII